MRSAFWQGQREALDEALRELNAVRDRWAARQGREPSRSHARAVHAEWDALAARDVAPQLMHAVTREVQP